MGRLGGVAEAGAARARAAGAALAVLALVAGPALLPVALAQAPAECPGGVCHVATAGPLDSIYSGLGLSCQVVIDGVRQYYGSSTEPSSCGTIVQAGGGAVHGTWVGGSDFTVTSTTMSAPAADGSVEVVTLATLPGTAVALRQTETYVPGDLFFTVAVEVHNQGADPVEVELWRAVDCYLGGSDSGYGYLDLGSRTVGCTAVPGGATGASETLQALTPGAHLGQGHYWGDVGQPALNGQPYGDTCACGVLQDNGMGLSWAFPLAAGQQSTVRLAQAFSTDGLQPILDDDGDGVPDAQDECPGTPLGTDVDSAGCPDGQAADEDGDGVPDGSDACPGTNPGVAVSANGCTLAASDEDGDGVPDLNDDCQGTAEGTHVDGRGCEAPAPPPAPRPSPSPSPSSSPSSTTPADRPPRLADGDGDGVPDRRDACPAVADPGQGDLDGDGAGDACDADRDGDGVDDEVELRRGTDPADASSAPAPPPAPQRVEVEPTPEGNLVAWTPSPGAAGYNVFRAASPFALRSSLPAGATDFLDRDVEDGHRYQYRIVAFDEDGVGAAGVPELVTGFEGLASSPVVEAVLDRDADGVRDREDPQPEVADPDADGDGVPLADDNCPGAANPGQADSDGDGRGDACEARLQRQAATVPVQPSDLAIAVALVIATFLAVLAILAPAPRRPQP